MHTAKHEIFWGICMVLAGRALDSVGQVYGPFVLYGCAAVVLLLALPKSRR